MAGGGAQSLLSFDNVVMSNYAFYATVLVLKLFLLAFMTSLKRIARNAFATPEDYKMVGKGRDDKPMITDPDVERIRRNHLNDLENTPAFLFLGLLFVLTGPNAFTALWHFRVFTISRFVHMIAYQVPLPQPCRALSFMVGVGTCISMALQILAKAGY
jgi:glutathione S-transferase